jgi:predicted DNA-binding ribbon-helix-helix protein
VREKEFEDFLINDSNIVSKTNAIRSRITKGRMVERHFDISLDIIVSDDSMMYQTLIRIRNEMKDTNGNISNALRKYYQFANGSVFPTLSTYKDLEGM